VRRVRILVPGRLRRRGFARGPGPLAAMVAAVSFLLAGVAGLLQERPLVAVPLLVVGAVMVALERLGAAAQGRAQVAATRALGGIPRGAAVELVGVSNLPALTRMFTGREPELVELARLLGGVGRVAVVAAHGLGGVGKTQLVLAYAHRHEEVFGVRWWIRASSRLTVVADLAELADELGLELDADQERTAARVLAELARRLGWLLIYDDAQDVADLAGLFPRAAGEAGGGQVLVTSRNPNFDVVGATLRVDPLPDPDAVAFLLARTGGDATSFTDRASAEQLAQVLGGLPLALEQAAAYCVATGIGLADYLSRYRRNAGRLLAAGTPGNYPVSVAVTWLLNVRQAARADAAAVQLLRLLAFVAPGAVPRDLISGAPPVLPFALALAAEDPLRLDRAVGVLRGMSLVTVDQPGQVRVHQLVQQVLRDRLDHDTRPWPRRLGRGVLGRLGLRGITGLDWTAGWPPRRWTKVTVKLLAEEFRWVFSQVNPNTSQEYVAHQRERCPALLPHALAALAHADRLHTDPDSAQTLRNALMFYVSELEHTHGVPQTEDDLEAARQLREQALEIRKRALGPDHSQTLDSMTNLALVLQAQGELDAARELHEQALELRLRAFHRGHQKLPDSIPLLELLKWMYNLELRPDHDQLLNSMIHLAFVLQEQGNHEAARELGEQALTLHRRTFHPSNEDRIDSMDKLAVVLAVQGDLDAARQLHEQVIQGQRRHLEGKRYWSRRRLGPEHPHTLAVMNDLALVLQAQGKLDTARELHEQTLTLRRRTLGPEHPDTLTSMTHLAAVLDAQGAERQAQEIRQQIAAAQRQP
jgi:tetratricopeptide (TPR) repeat protein